MFSYLPKKDGVYVLPDLIQEEPVSYVTVTERFVHQHPPLVPCSPIDLVLEDMHAQLGQGDGGDPVKDVEGGEGEEEHIPEI